MHFTSEIDHLRRCLRGLVTGGLLAVLLCLTTASGQAQETQGTPPPLQPAETPPPPPRVVAHTPAPEPVAAPMPTVMPTPRIRAPRATPTPSSDEPAAVVNGSTVYRPLFRSVVADPVDRALVLREYHRRGLVLPATALEEAVKNHTKSAFGDQKTLMDKLHDQGATFDDYRAFVAEEVKLNAMLSIVSKGGRTDSDRKGLRDTFVAELRKKATVNKPKKT